VAIFMPILEGLDGVEKMSKSLVIILELMNPLKSCSKRLWRYRMI
jgi:tyrosyl-tRNA synthetase